jgi:hypothetical protein
VAALSNVTRPRFAHESEAELARILDYYQVEWRYEPDTFPLSWNASGAVVECFAPDFYLPQFDMYLELTTLKQSLVRKKNRKLRWLRLLYPEVRVKLLYARDFKALMIKYGRGEFLGRILDGNVTQGRAEAHAERLAAGTGTTGEQGTRGGIGAPATTPPAAGADAAA